MSNVRFEAMGIAAVCLSTAGCVDTSPDRVKLTADITDVSLSATQSSLVTSLGGSFVVNLNLGDLATEPSTISDPIAFQLVTAADRSTLVGLDALVQGATFPVQISPGGHLALSYQLNDQKSLATDDLSRICAGEVEIAATLRDTSNGDRPLSFDSDPTTPVGCH